MKKEKYLIVTKHDKGKPFQQYLFKDSDLDISKDTLIEYENATANRFEQKIKFFDKKEYEDKLKEIKLQNIKLQQERDSKIPF